MCFPKAPKPPPTTDPVLDPELARQRIEIELNTIAQKADAKKRRMEEQLAILSGKIGRKSLFSGGAGGMGFGSVFEQSLFTGQGGAAAPGPGAVGNYTPGSRYSFYAIPAGGSSGGGSGGGGSGGSTGGGSTPPGGVSETNPNNYGSGLPRSPLMPVVYQ